MRLSKDDKDENIVELYKMGYSFRQLQKKYHKSPNYIAKLVKGIEVRCAACGKPKGKVRFHAHQPGRVNQHTIIPKVNSSSQIFFFSHWWADPSLSFPGSQLSG